MMCVQSLKVVVEKSMRSGEKWLEPFLVVEERRARATDYATALHSRVRLKVKVKVEFGTIAGTAFPDQGCDLYSLTVITESRPRLVRWWSVSQSLILSIGHQPRE
jgi:hypothetical protein